MSPTTSPAPRHRPEPATNGRSPRPAAATETERAPVLDPIYGAGTANVADDGSVTLRYGAKDWPIVARLMNVGAGEAGRRVRENALAAAVTDRRIASSELATWRARWQQDPTEASSALKTLTSGSASVMASAGGVGSASSPASPSSTTQVTAKENGLLYYRDQYPVSVNSAGAPCVLTHSGWLAVDQFERSDLGEADLTDALHSARLVRGGVAARALREGAS